MAKKILIIDDSALMRRVISDIIKTNEQYEVADFAHDGLEGFDKIVSNPKKYDAVILDINMPKMNGLELLEMLQKNRIQQKVIVVSTVAKEGAKETIKALELGAFDFVTKPENFIEAKGNDFKERILEMLEVATGGSCDMSVISNMTSTVSTKPSIKTFSSTATKTQTAPSKATFERSTPVIDSKSVVPGSKLVALACSTGGPKSLQQVIPLLPANLDAPMVMVQHMPAGFTKSLAQRLDEMGPIHVKEAEDGDILEKGTVYIAPGGRHMRIVKSGKDSKVALSDEPPVDALRPCANVMYESLLGTSYDQIICVVLTGMGADGTKGIQALNGKKNIYVIGQDAASCIVYGMPKAIAESGLVNEVKPLDDIANAITKKTGVH